MLKIKREPEKKEGVKEKTENEKNKNFHDNPQL